MLPLVRQLRDADEGDERARLLLLAVARTLEPLCNARRDGKAMRYRYGWRDVEWTLDRVRGEIDRAIDCIQEDLDSAPLGSRASTRFFKTSAFDALP